MKELQRDSVEAEKCGRVEEWKCRSVEMKWTGRDL